MERNIVNLGSSKGIIIPAKFIKLLSIKDKVEMDIENQKIIIKPIKSPRKNWRERMSKDIEKNGLEKSLIPYFFDYKTLEDWKW